MKEPIAKLSFFDFNTDQFCIYYLPPFFPHKDWITRKLSLPVHHIRPFKIDIFRPTYYYKKSKDFGRHNPNANERLEQIRESFHIWDKSKIEIFSALTNITHITKESIFELACKIQKDGNIKKLKITDMKSIGRSSNSLDKFIDELSENYEKNEHQKNSEFYSFIHGLFWVTEEYIALPQFAESNILEKKISTDHINYPLSIREDLIIEAIKSLGYDPQKLAPTLFPKGRNGGLRKLIFNKISANDNYLAQLENNRINESKSKTLNSFNYNWQNLIKKQYIRIFE
ncbi:hypothetical protein [Acinetobacter guillouiae]|uniref:hypothetical protein n=1 Tax=Acinetobacter guillouiae TaxID=106649 RepID=UPI002FDB3885